MQTKKWTYRVLKMLKWLLLSLIGLIGILLMLVYTPPAQRWLTEQGVQYLSQKLDTRVEIEGVSLLIPSLFGLEGVRIDTPEGDTLVYLQELEVSLDMWALLKRQLVIEEVSLQGLRAKIITTDSSRNYQFVLDAFAPVDTTIVATPPSQTEASAWEIIFSELEVYLGDTEVYYLDQPAGLLLDGRIGYASLSGDTINLKAQVFLLDRVNIANTQLKVRVEGRGESPVDTTARNALMAGFKKLECTEVAVDIKADSLLLLANIEELMASDFRFRQDEELEVRLYELESKLRQLDYHQHQIVTPPSFDPAHLALADLQVEAQEVNYQHDSLSLKLPLLRVRDSLGNWEIEHFSTQLRFWPGHLLVDNLQLNTPRSELRVPKLDYEFPNQTASAWEALAVQADAQIQLEEWVYFVPGLRSQAFYLAHPKARIQLRLAAATEGEDLRIANLTLHAPGLHLDATGTLAHPLQAEALTADLQIAELAIRPREIESLLPAGTSPDYLTWPERLVATGQLAYNQQQLTLDLSAREERTPDSPWSFFRVHSSLRGLESYPNTQVDLQLDTLLVTRPTILAYTPTPLLPPGYSWPEQLSAHASFSGMLNNLQLKLQLQLPEATTRLELLGTVQHLFDEDQLALNLRIPDLRIRPGDLQPLLPDSLLPGMIAFPELQIRQGELRGTPDSLQFDLPIYTTNGNWQLAGSYRKDWIQTRVQINDIRAADFFRGPLRDSLLALDLQPLDVTAKWEGSLAPRLNTQVEATLTEQDRGQLLALTATVADTGYRATAVFDHPDFQGRTRVSFTPSDSLARLSGELTLDRLDLYRWGFSSKPLVASGAVDWKSSGLASDKLDGHVRIDNLLLRGSGSTAYVDSLLLRAQLNDGENELQLSGDVVDGYLRGRFDPLAIGPELIRFIEAYTKAAPFEGDAVVHGHQLDLLLEVKNPRPLTTGLIPGLTELEPFTFSLRYRDEQPELQVDLTMPQLTFAGLTTEGMRLEARGDEQQLRFTSAWRDIRYGQEVMLGSTRITGESGPQGLGVALELGAPESLRYRLAANYLLDEQTASLSLAPEQLINFQTWRAPEANQLQWSEDTLIVSQWELRKGAQFLQLSTAEEELEFAFQNFPLGQWTSLLNPEQVILSGMTNGELTIADIFGTPVLSSDLRIENLGFYGQPQGNLRLALSQSAKQQYALDAVLGGAWHDLKLSGSYSEPDGLDLQLLAQQLSLTPLAPFIETYISDPRGSVRGELSVSGKLEAPRFQGQLTFAEVALTPSLLGSQLLIDEQSIQFTGDEIKVEDFRIQDETEAEIIMSGKLALTELTNPTFDLKAQARNFLALNSKAEDNDLFYGYLRVNADLDISGSLNQPRVIVTAAPAGDSRLTYAYTSETSASLQSTAGIVTFAETYEWPEILANGKGDDSLTTAGQGAYIETNLTINPSLLTKVIVDPITQQAFSGRGEGDVTFIQYPNGNQQLSGQVELASGTYDMVLEGLRRYTFEIKEGSRVYFTGDPTNPQLDLTIANTVQTSPLPLIEAFAPAEAEGRLGRRQTFEVVLDLTGDLSAMSIDADIRYPEDAYGNQGYVAVEEALSSLRQDQSRLYTTAITLVTFRNFVLPQAEGNSNTQQGIVNGVAGAVGDALSNLLNEQLGFVDVDLGVDSYDTAAGEANYNLRLSLQKSFFDDRLVISVDGVTNTATSTDGSEAASYLDNISVAYLLDEKGQLKIKLFNDRDRNVFVGGNVIRFGGRLVFSKDFDHFFWEKKN